MRAQLALVLLSVSYSPVFCDEQDLSKFNKPSSLGADQLPEPVPHQVGPSRAIWDSDGELLQPYVATRLLTGVDYVEWSLRWNARQYELAKQRSRPPRKVSGWVTEHRSQSQVAAAAGFFRYAGRGSHRSTTRSYARDWYLNGYGGGPVTLYNPFFVNEPAAASDAREKED